MGWTDLVLRLRALVTHDRAEGELDEELRFHMEMEARKARAAGLSDEEARRRARVRFGGVDQVAEECRDVRGLTFLENLARDLCYGARVLRKTPGFAIIAVLSLAIGIGANTAVFSLVNTVLLRMLPVRNPEQLVVATWGARADLNLNATWVNMSAAADGGWVRNVFSWAIFSEMRARSRSLGLFTARPRESRDQWPGAVDRRHGGFREIILKYRPALTEMPAALHANGVKLILIQKLDKTRRNFVGTRVDPCRTEKATVSN
jgi:hypothetical protein